MIAASVAAALALIGAYLLLGRYPSPGFLSLERLGRDPLALRIVLSLRAPRALAALLLGACLAGAGATFQAIFGNPLVEAGFLGVSQGAAFGAALALVLGVSGSYPVAASAFAFSLLALRVSLWLSKRFHFGGQVLRLVLSGIAVSAFFASALAATKYVADPLSQLPDITFWTMGGLSAVTWAKVAAVAPIAAVSLAAMLALRWRATILSLDDEASRALGARPELERGVLIVAATAGVAAMTALCGIVSWVGLVLPHAGRLLAGPDGRASIPASIGLGAVFVLACDAAARSLFPGELPLGIVTSIAGSALFILLLSRRRAAVLR